jgi:hypothetical protein
VRPKGNDSIAVVANWDSRPCKLPFQLMKTKLIPLVCTLAVVLSGTGNAFQTVSEKFEGAELDPFRWFQFRPTKARLLLEDGKLNFVLKGTPTVDDFASIELRSTYPSEFEDWEMTVKLSNTEKISKQAGCGFMIFNGANRNDYFYMNFFSSFGISSGFFTDLTYTPADALSLASVAPIGAVRVSYSSTTRLITISASRKKDTGGFLWKVMGTFSPFGAPGGDVTTNWTLPPGSQFATYGFQLFGSASSSRVGSGRVTIDDFKLKQIP